MSKMPPKTRKARGVVVFVGEHEEEGVAVMQIWFGWCRISIEPRSCSDLEARREKDVDDERWISTGGRRRQRCEKVRSQENLEEAPDE